MAGGAVKVGPWGRGGGTPCDINVSSKPRRLESITVSSAEIPTGGRIFGFSFVYVDQKGYPITVGPWGASFPGYGKRIDIKPGEHLNHVSGTSDGATGITSLTFATNQSKYGPYGFPSGTPFSLPLQQGKGEVLAFFATAAPDSLKSLGVYVPSPRKTTKPYHSASVVKVGPWGGYGGTPRDINLGSNRPEKLRSVTVRSTESSGGRVYSFGFAYVDENGSTVRAGPWGKKTNRGEPHTVTMNQGEYVNHLSGTADDYGVTSIKLRTNQDEYGPFGCSSGTAFDLPLPDNGTGDEDDNGAAVAFFGRSGDSLVAIGVYVGIAPPEYEDEDAY